MDKRYSTYDQWGGSGTYETTDWNSIEEMIDQNDGLLENVICHTIDAEGKLTEVRLLSDKEIGEMLSEYETAETEAKWDTMSDGERKDEITAQRADDMHSEGGE